MRRWVWLLSMPLSGALFGLAFPRTGWWSLAWVGLFPLIMAMRRQGTVSPYLLGVAWGAAFFIVLLSWLYEFFRHFGQMGPVLSAATLGILAAYLSVYSGLFAHFGSIFLQRHGDSGMFLLPPLWVTLEWVRAHALSGFPWGIAGYALVPCLPLVQIASITGVYGISFLVVLVNATAAVWLDGSSRLRGIPVRLSLVALGSLAGVFAFGAWQMSLPVGKGPQVVVGLVQASIPQDEKWSASAAREILDVHERLTQEAVDQGARLILWPESSSPYPLSHPPPSGVASEAVPESSYRRDLEALSQRTDASLLFGTVDYRRVRGEIRPVNAAAMVRPDGSWGETYAKMHLVPFGEYVPLAPILGFVNRVAQGAIGDFVPGRRPVVSRTNRLSVGTCICYEMVFPELVRLFPLRGAELLANLTNDAWFGTSSGPAQHFQMAILRAVENRRFLVRAANTGISAIVDPRGKILSRTVLQERKVLTGTVQAVRERTVYTRVGDVFAILCVILTTAALAAAFVEMPRSLREGDLGY